MWICVVQQLDGDGNEIKHLPVGVPVKSLAPRKAPAAGAKPQWEQGTMTWIAEKQAKQFKLCKK